jgi:hypothetical protein
MLVVHLTEVALEEVKGEGMISSFKTFGYSLKHN